MRPARLVALDWMLDQADHGQKETGGPNRSTLIDRVNRYAGVPPGSSYCASAIKYAFHRAGVDDFGGQLAASVGFTEKWAETHGYTQARPLRGDAFCWKLDGDDWPDHAGMVVKVASWGGLFFTVWTVEANTSSGNVGSQSDGGGWYRRRRTFRRGLVSFVRDPRVATKDRYVKVPPRWYLNALKLPPLWAWVAWKDHGAPTGQRPPQIPVRVPTWWFARYALHKGV